jgi:hypothetical protein
MVGTTAALGAAGAALGAGAASAAPTAAGKRGRLPYPAGVTDTSHCTPEVAEIFRGFYSAKSEHDAPRLMSYFSKKSAYYIDASSGSLWPSWDALNALFTPFFASGLPADALSYPLRIVGDASSAMVEFEAGRITCIELDESGQISRLTAIYDSSLISYQAYLSLVALAAEAPL